jgi:hypothetical protein
MVSEKDRAHFRSIAAGLDSLEREELAVAGRRPSGANIAISFDLSRFVMSRSSDFSRPLPVSLAKLWRDRHLQDRER